jgi:hypothetical protein
MNCRAAARATAEEKHLPASLAHAHKGRARPDGRVVLAVALDEPAGAPQPLAAHARRSAAAGSAPRLLGVDRASNVGEAGVVKR